MDHPKTRAYIKTALQRHHKVERIIGKLVSAGHNEDVVRRLTKQLLTDRISYLEQQKRAVKKAKPANFNGLTLEIMFSFLLRFGLGLVGAVLLGSAILNTAIVG